MKYRLKKPGRFITILVIAIILVSNIAISGVIVNGAHKMPLENKIVGYETTIVGSSDTLWSIANRTQYLGCDPRDIVYIIREVNDLSGCTINPGQELLIPILK